ncbi:ABC transporter ATP-binding protein [Hathewaya limosa]|uniref:ABC-2 type transport system ATP-binding protein n=1 Tax=Hathewaya limosa TaxID=1536 RepID=A0ABU0JQD8_HATLI|nr:ABC transporter ATP-binding protein [Hathewaya limosa]AWZ49246.1 export ABC transporter ATP-binding protein [Clostridiaceae bacterium 14S0207]MDQ0478466.1 ABC-2 type transport system ATP-binding protein [Hathewaya limosa]
MSLVEIKNLCKRFGQHMAVKDISLNIEEGQIYGLLGPNGAGKSTTINIICGLLSKDSGDINIFNKPMNKKARDIKKNLGVVPQDIAIYEDLTAYENIAFFASLYGVKGKELKKRVAETLEFVGLKDKAKEYPAKFSGGMKRRLNIACAIVHEPRLIVMDEPTVGIDPQSRNHILESIKELNRRGCTIIYTSHYMEEVEAICSNLAIMDQGKVIAEGEKHDLIQKYTDCSTIIVEVHSVEHIEELNKLKGVQSVVVEENNIIIKRNSNEMDLQDVIEVITKNNMIIKSIESKNNDLEHIFLSLTGKKLRD